MGHRLVDGRLIEFNVEGAEDGPDPGLVRDVLHVLRHFSSFWEDGMRLIREEAPKHAVKNVAHFQPDAVFNFRRDSDSWYFMMGLSLAGDEYRLWRLEFFDGRAKYLGYDD